MRDLGPHAGGGSSAGALLPALAEVRRWTKRLGGSGRGLDDTGRIDLIRALEELKCAAEGAQAELTADFDSSMRARAARAGEPPERQGRGIAAQIALARRESPHKGQRHVGLAKVLRSEIVCTRAALRAGKLTEWRATLLARETACLPREKRLEIDGLLADDPERIEQLGERELVEEARRLVCRLDPRAVAERRRRAEADRHTTLRPAPDVMTVFSAVLPVKDGVAVHAALLREANRARATGDPRSRGAIMADTLVSRVLGAHATTTGSRAVPLVINVVVPDDVLVGSSSASGYVDGYGTVPGDLLCEWIAANAEAGVRDWVRRLYVRPETGDLVAMDKQGRRLDGRLAGYLRLRDQRCRTPYCDAPVRHVDHVEAVAKGGRSSARNAQGLCEHCNYAKEAIGWTARPRPGPRHTVETTTPTGHRYLSTAAPILRGTRLRMETYPLDIRVG
jgi:5-methylcytosine-specific restriction endonuclease McrA